MLSNPGGCCRLSMRALRLPFRISCDSWDRQRVCKVTEGRSDSWKISSLFRSRERSSMTYCGFSEVPLKGHLKWTSYQISNLFKAHDSHLLFAPSFAGEQKPSKELFRSFGKPLLCSRTEMKRPWRGKMAKKVSKLWLSFKVIRVRLVFFCMNASSSRKKIVSWDRAQKLTQRGGLDRLVLWLIEDAICFERKIDTTCSQNFERFLRIRKRKVFVLT